MNLIFIFLKSTNYMGPNHCGPYGYFYLQCAHKLHNYAIFDDKFLETLICSIFQYSSPSKNQRYLQAQRLVQRL